VNVVSGPKSDATGTAILDAANRVLVDVGFRHATVELIAEGAGLSPTVIYRRWPDKAELLRATIQRELSLAVDQAFDEAAAKESFDDVVPAVFAGIVWAVRNHPLMTREMSAEPDIALPIVSAESGPVLDALVAQVAESLQVAAAAGNRLLPDPEALADVFVRLAHALVLMPDSTRPVAGRGECELYARRHLLPIARSATVAATAESAGSCGPASANPSRRQRFRRAHLQFAPPVALALLLSSGALAAALVQPWSAPVTPNIVNDSGSTPAPHTEGQTALEPDTFRPSTIPSPWAVAVPPPAAPLTPPSQTSVAVIDVFQPVQAQPPTPAVPGRESPSSPRPPLPPPARKPGPPPAPAPAPALGVAPHPGPAPGPAGGAPSGPAQHPAGHGGGNH
jgi:AcrR family transcriptional regulator